MIGDVHAIAVEHHIGKAAEGIHAGQGRYKGRYLQLGNPEPLECADGKTDGEHGKHGQPDIGTRGHHDTAHGCGKADHRTHGEVNVTAGKDTQEHAGCQNEYVGVLGNETRQIGGQKDQTFLAGPSGEDDRHHDKGDDHRILLKKLAQVKAPGGIRCAFLAHCHAPLPDLRIAVMIFSCVASSAFISPTIFASFMM